MTACAAGNSGEPKVQHLDVRFVRKYSRLHISAKNICFKYNTFSVIT